MSDAVEGVVVHAHGIEVVALRHWQGDRVHSAGGARGLDAGDWKGELGIINCMNE
jgi:hypothetical protein